MFTLPSALVLVRTFIRSFCVYSDLSGSYSNSSNAHIQVFSMGLSEPWVTSALGSPSIHMTLELSSC